MRPSGTQQRWPLCALLVAASVVAAGCGTVPEAEHRAVQRNLLVANERINQLETQIAGLQESTRVLQERIRRLQGVDAQAAEALVVPTKIVLARLSGGYDDDGKPGDEGIVLFVQPIDKDGDVVKAAGALKVMLFDLAELSNNLIAEYRFDADRTRGLWNGRLMTNHFSVRCPWPEGRPPGHREVTARVVFTELLTGSSLTAQGVYQIAYPPVLPDQPAASTQ